MTRSLLLVAALAAPLCLAPIIASAQPGDERVAGAFMAAAQSQDRKAALDLLDQGVSIHFSSSTGEAREGQGQPFVIGYLDGLFDAQGVSLDPASAPQGEAVRFHARDPRSNVRYAIDVTVRARHVVALSIDKEDAGPTSHALAALD